MISIRKNRVWYPGATYHVMKRGIRRLAIFKEETDYEVFLLLLKKAIKKYGCKLHAYCLMTNHVHILLETSEYEIGKPIREVAGNYALYFNQKYNCNEHLFEGRFKSGIVTDDEYFLQSGRYIHLNPVKAGMVSYPNILQEFSHHNIRFRKEID